MPSLYMNGRNYTGSGSGEGGGNVYGAFIDTNRVIQASTSVASGTTDTYTATEDCAVHIVFVGSTNPSRAYIDGVEVETHYASQTAFVTHVLYIRRGQVFSLESGDNSTNYTVYGLTFGTQNIFTPQIYSTEERCVGVWIDNKPLYQKSMAFDNTSNNNLSIDVTGLSIDSLVEGKIWNRNTGFQVNSYYNTAEDQINAYYDETGYIHIRRGTAFAGTGYVTLLYTKTTDTAGSGSYNTLGVPMVHIEDNIEYIIGTYNGETLYRKRYKFTNPSAGDQMHPYNITGSIKEIVNFYGVWHRDMTSAGNGLWAYQINAENEISTQEQFRVLARPRKESGVEGIYTYFATSGAYSGAVADICITIEYTKSSS